MKKVPQTVMSERVFDLSDMKFGGILALCREPRADHLCLTDAMSGAAWDIPIETAMSLAQSIIEMVGMPSGEQSKTLKKAGRSAKRISRRDNNNHNANQSEDLSSSSC